MDTTKLEHMIQDAVNEAIQEEEQAVVLGSSCAAYANLASILAYALEKVNGLLEFAHRDWYGRL